MHALPILAFALPTWALGISVAAFVAISLLMIGVILLQRPQGGGLAAAFGGAQGAGQTAFGTKTGDALTLFTCFVFAVWVGTAVFLTYALQPASANAAAPAVVPVPEEKPKTTPATPVTPAGTTPAPAVTPSTTPATPATAPAAPAEAPKTPEQPK